MKFLIAVFLSVSLFFPQKIFSQENELNNCDKVQSLFNWLRDVKGEQLKSNTFACKPIFLIDGFNNCAINVQSVEQQKWSVSMISDEHSRADADSFYVHLVETLIKCPYLNSWKATEKPGDKGLYNFTLDQIYSSNNGRLKNITIYLLPANSKWKVEMKLVN